MYRFMRSIALEIVELRLPPNGFPPPDPPDLPGPPGRSPERLALLLHRHDVELLVMQLHVGLDRHVLAD